MSGVKTPVDEFAPSDAQEDVYSAVAEVGAVRERRTRRQRTWIALKKAPFSAWFGMIVIGLYFITALFAPIIAPYGEAQVFKTPTKRLSN